MTFNGLTPTYTRVILISASLASIRDNRLDNPWTHLLCAFSLILSMTESVILHVNWIDSTWSYGDFGLNDAVSSQSTVDTATILMLNLIFCLMLRMQVQNFNLKKFLLSSVGQTKLLINLLILGNFFCKKFIFFQRYT